MQRQQWDPETYRKNARFVPELGVAVLDMLKPKPGERLLDLGCGDGFLTEKLVAAGSSVVALDSSIEQARAARVRGLDVIAAEGPFLPFCQTFDAVFSNATLHWIRDAAAMIGSVYRVLMPGGRFVAELGGRGNIRTIHLALSDSLARRGLDADRYDPWIFPSVEEYQRLLESHGFLVRTIELIPRPTALPGHLSQWLETFAQPFIHALAPIDREDFIRDVCAAVEPYLYDPERGWIADYVRLRFEAHVGPDAYLGQADEDRRK
jgi:SAM-dependent methyltransferase